MYSCGCMRMSVHPQFHVCTCMTMQEKLPAATDPWREISKALSPPSFSLIQSSPLSERSKHYSHRAGQQRRGQSMTRGGKETGLWCRGAEGTGQDVASGFSLRSFRMNEWNEVASPLKTQPSQTSTGISRTLLLCSAPGGDSAPALAVFPAEVTGLQRNFLFLINSSVWILNSANTFSCVW